MLRALLVARRIVTIGILVEAVLLGVRAYHVLVPARAIVGGDVALARGGRSGIRVLFVGNSFTAANGLPELVHELAAADRGGRPLFAVAYVRPGGTLSQAARDARLVSLLRSIRWDDVVLQEQSELQSFSAADRRRWSDPYARDLAARAASAGARTILFMTWGYEHGDGRNYRHDTFGAMETRLAAGYWTLAAELSAPVAPVGLAWADALRRRPRLELWARDGKHPSRTGSYLAACVLYTTLTQRDPRGNPFHAGLDATTAALLEQVASRY